ncbi:INO80 complex subunit C isoform X3 [Vulpes lagopus]|uniref:INO80 complex subunit C isoform X3 n=1 Tax=Vulpes lagopus TaxID=494514 RepID=UPI001BCA6220|nr:INO80 complex subunit C isoform X3 [Vulpes lagopus]
MRGAVRGGARARAQSRAELAGPGPRCRAFQVLGVSPPVDAVAGADEIFFLNVGKRALVQAPHALHCPREQERWRCCCRLSGMIIPSRLVRLRPRTSLSFRQAQILFPIARTRARAQVGEGTESENPRLTLRSVETDTGLDIRTLRYDLSQSQESDA